MSEYVPDNWKIVKISSKEHGDTYKILSSWQGGYLDADVWKLSSGFVDMIDEEDRYRSNQQSGSLYVLIKNNEKESRFIKEKFNEFNLKLKDVDANIEYVKSEGFMIFLNSV